MKETVLQLINNAIGGAEDNLYRAKRRFDPAKEDIGKEYGQSGRTCQEILDGYQQRYDELISARKWLTDL